MTEGQAMTIVFASHTYIGSPFVVGSHHLSREMAGMGHKVMHISTAVTPLHLLKLKQRTIGDRFKIWMRIRRKEERVVNCVPYSWVPWSVAKRLYRSTGINWFVRGIGLPGLSRMLKLHRFEQVDLLLIDQPAFAGIEKFVKAKVVLYRPTDIYADMSGDETIRSVERDIVSRSHGIVATSDPVYRNIRQYDESIPGMIVENGVEFERFSCLSEEPEELKNIPHPRAIYVGAIDDRFDLEAIERLAHVRDDISLVLIGPIERSRRTIPTARNIHWLGAIDYERLPAFLQYSDVALLPMSEHAANSGRSPMKLYEYAAAGLPTVVTATSELLRRQESFLFFYSGKEQFVEQVGKVLELSRNQAIGKEDIQETAKKQAWKSKAEQILAFGKSLRGQ